MNIAIIAMLAVIYLCTFLFILFPFKPTSKADALEWILICLIWPINIIIACGRELYEFWSSLPDED